MRALSLAAFGLVTASLAAQAQVAWQQLDGPQLNSVTWMGPGTNVVTAAYDATRSRLVAVDHGERLFEHDGSRWLDRGPCGSPVFLLDDPVSHRLLGGYYTDGTLRLESWDGVAWTALPGALPGLFLWPFWGTAVFDSVRNRVVLAAQTGTGWAIHEWNGATWQQVAALPATPQFYYHTTLAFDPVLARTLLKLQFVQGTAVWDEVWSWNGTTLASLGTGTMGGTRWNCYGTCWNQVTSRVEFFSNTVALGGPGLFTWGPGGVQLLTAMPAGSAPMTFSNGACDPSGRTYLVERTSTTGPGGLWVLENGIWEFVDSGSGEIRLAGAMAFDPNRGEVVYSSGYTPFVWWEGTSLWNGRHWKWNPNAPQPLRGEAACATDPLGRGVVLFGGEENIVWAYGVRDDTWLWNGTTWSLQASGPSARCRSAMVLDSARQRVVMCGGCWAPGTVGHIRTPLQDTWEWDGVVWTQHAPMPVARGRHALAYDALRAHTVLFGGEDATAARDDTLVWNGVAWTTLAPSVKPPAGLPSMAFDPDRGVVTLVVHTPAAMTAWNWDGGVWSPDPTPLPSVRNAGSIQPQVVFDPVRRRLLYHNGIALHAYTPTPSRAVAYGTGCGRPVGFVLAHPPHYGSVLQCDLVDALSSGLVGVGVGLGAANAGIGNGCTLLTQNSILWRLGTSSESGFASVQFPLPNHLALRGLTAYLQGAVLDANSPAGFALTNGIAATIGD